MNSEDCFRNRSCAQAAHEAELSNMEYKQKHPHGLPSAHAHPQSRAIWAHGSYAVYRAKAPKKRIAFRADFDALPIDESGSCLPYRSITRAYRINAGRAQRCLAAFADTIDKGWVTLLPLSAAEEVGDGARSAAS